MELSTFIIIIVLVAIYIKLNTLTDTLDMIKNKVDTLEHSLNDLSPNEQKPLPKTVHTPPKQVYHEPQKEPINASVKVQQMGSLEKLQKRFGSKSLEDFLIGNLLLNVSIVAFVLSIGFFLKYSIDQNWIPIWGRVLIGILIALVMLFGGIKTIKNSHKLFSEGLFGGGIAILYLSIFAGYALNGFIFLDFTTAFSTMVVITILSGVIALRYDSMTTAVFGLIGGFSTPFLINTGANDIQSLMLYILLLNFGILYIAFSKQWSILNWLSFIFTALIEIGAVYKSLNLFIFLAVIFFVLFMIYSIVPFLHKIRTKEIKLTPVLVMLFGANLLIFLALMAQLIHAYGIDFKYAAIITTLTAAYLLGYAYWLKQKGIFAQNLLYAILSQALALLLITPAILFKGDVLAVIWVIEALVLFFIAQKSDQKSFLWFGFLGLALGLFRYIGINLIDTYNLSDIQHYLDTLLPRILSGIIIISAYFVMPKLRFSPVLEKIISEYQLRSIVLGSGIVLLFLFLNVESANGFRLFIPKAEQIAMTLLWILFGIGLFVISLNKNIAVGKQVGIGLIIIATLKAFFVDLADVDALYRILLFMLVGILLFVLAYFYKKKN